MGSVPYDPVVTEAMVRGQPVTAYDDGPVTRSLHQVWEHLRKVLWP